MDAVVVYQGPDSADVMYSRSQSVMLYLFGYELPDTIAVFTLHENLYLLTSQKKGHKIATARSVQFHFPGSGSVTQSRPGPRQPEVLCTGEKQC